MIIKIKIRKQESIGAPFFVVVLELSKGVSFQIDRDETGAPFSSERVARLFANKINLYKGHIT